MAKRVQQNESIRKRRRSLRTRKKNGANIKSQVCSKSQVMKVKRRSEKSFQNISSSSLNTTNLADCYDFDLEDEDCRKKLNLSKNATKKKSAEKKVKATTRKKGGSLQSKQRTQKTNLKKKLVSKSVKTSDKCAEPLAVNMECRGNIPVLAGGRRETDSVKKNNKTTHAAGVGVLVSPFHNISKIDPVVVIERITSTPSVAKLGQTSFNNQLKLAASKKRESRQLKTQSSAAKKSPPVGSTMGSRPTAGRSSTANPDSVRGGNFDPVDSPMLSPVHKVDALGCEEYVGFVSSQSDLFDSVDYTSSRTSCPEIDDVKSEPFSLLDISKTYSNLGFGFFDLPLEKKKKKRRHLKKTTRNSINQYDILASQINQEFDDLDEFQLSID